MNEIIILNEAPAILTKDGQWASRVKPNLKRGSIIVLPPDAVLVMPPTNPKKEN